MLHVAAKDVVSGRTVEMKMRNYGEFIREDEDFDINVTREGAIALVTPLPQRFQRIDVQIQHKQASFNRRQTQHVHKMRDLMPVVEFDDTEEPTELDGELIGTCLVQ